MDKVETSPYIILRAEQSGKAVVVHRNESVKDARYWLNYIAMPGDALFTTSAHPKYVGSGEPQYFAHLLARKKMVHDEKMWRKTQLAENAVLTIVEPDENQNDSKRKAPSERIPLCTEEKAPTKLTLEQLDQLRLQLAKGLDLVLVDSEKWIDWESALMLRLRDTIIVGVDRTSKFPIKVSYDPKKDGDWIAYNPGMFFAVKRTK